MRYYLTMTSSIPSPLDEYSQRLAKAHTESEALDRQHDRLALIRFLIAGAAVICIYLGATQSSTFYWLAGLCVVAFVGISLYHSRILNSLRRAQRLTKFYEAGIRRIDGTWPGKGISGDRFSDPKHPFSGDLDLFGRASLFEMLCTARTRSGEDALADLLTAPTDTAAIAGRQSAVEDLRGRLELREDLGLLGEDMRSQMDPERLAKWGVQPPVFTQSFLRPMAFVCTALVIIGATVWGITHNSIAFWAAVIIARVYAYFVSAEVNQVIRALRKTGDEFSLLTELLARLEKETGKSALVGDLHNTLHTDGKSASSRLRALAELVGYLDAMSNQLFMPIGTVLIWSTHCAFAIEAWRARHGAHVARWLDAVGQYEALVSLAAYAYEHPERPFAEVSDTGPAFTATTLFHPLMPPGKGVANDVTIDDSTIILIVSGSNMSGKSTLLRSVGTNAVLAMAGAPVCATRLQFQPRTLGASIRTQDSLEGGISRFYAEILRLRQIVELAQSGPTLFLIDEILHGTNSHDRRVGGEAVLRALAAHGSAGLATTHDLALARIAEDPALHAGNVHFEDQIEDGKMTFDYHLRPGIVTRSNALELMRAVGLEV